MYKKYVSVFQVPSSGQKPALRSATPLYKCTSVTELGEARPKGVLVIDTRSPCFPRYFSGWASAPRSGQSIVVLLLSESEMSRRARTALAGTIQQKALIGGLYLGPRTMLPLERKNDPDTPVPTVWLTVYKFCCNYHFRLGHCLSGAH